jgi:hypothetical protein
MSLGSSAFRLEFNVGGLTVWFLDLNTVRRYTPDGPRPPEKSATLAATRKVTWTGRDGSINSATLSNLRFVQYRPAGSGVRYVDVSAGWSTLTALSVAQAVVGSKEVVVSQLARIEFAEKYDTARKAALSLVDGQSMAVTITGPTIGSEWTADLEEGLVGDLSSAVRVFIPFPMVRSIDIAAL